MAKYLNLVKFIHVCITCNTCEQIGHPGMENIFIL